MIKNGYYPKKLIYLGDTASQRKAILVSSPDEYADVILEAIQLGEEFEYAYRQVAAASGAEFVDISNIKVIKEENDND